MPLVKALRALLVLFALFAIVPTQTGGALAINELGLCATEACLPDALGERPSKQSPAGPAPHASFVAPDDGTAAGATLPDWPSSPLSTPPRVTRVGAIESPVGVRLERPPKSI